MFKITSIRNRLMLYFLLVILPVMLVVSLTLYSWLKHYYFVHQEEMLVRSGTLAAEFVRGYMKDDIDQPRLISLTENIGHQTQPPTRLIVVDSKKNVIGDSLRVNSKLGKKLDRVEINDALRGEISRSVQYSEESRNWIMQVAVPVRSDENDNSTPIGAIFLSASLLEVYQILGDIRMLLFWMTMAAVFLVAVASFLLARRFSDPLGALTLAAQNMADGDLDQKIKISSGDEIGRLAGQFNVMAERIDYMTRNLQAFAANVSHELRTPLATLSILIQSLKEHEMEPEQQQDFFEDLDQQTQRLTNLVTDLLELTKLQHTRTKEHGKHFSLRNILLEVIEQMSHWFSRANVKFTHEIPVAVLMISGSPGQIRQVFYNLLDNALKFTGPGGQVNITAWEEADTVEIKVEDTGKGIPMDEQKLIFERFFRVDTARSRDEGGMGLGLAIAREIVEVHGGTIRVESQEDQGSSFYVSLPRVIVTQKPEEK